MELHRFFHSRKEGSRKSIFMGSLEETIIYLIIFTSFHNSVSFLLTN